MQHLFGVYLAALDNITTHSMSVLYLSITACVMPLRQILAQLHNYLADNDYSLSVDDLCDLGILFCTLTQIYIY